MARHAEQETSKSHADIPPPHSLGALVRQRAWAMFRELGAARRETLTHVGSVFLRHVDCGSCNGCELELRALTGPTYALDQYGLSFVESPAHADLIILTGVLTRGMIDSVRRAVDAMPVRRVLAVGDCAIDGGEFVDSYAYIACGPDLWTAENLPSAGGCPPEPRQILDAMLVAGQLIRER